MRYVLYITALLLVLCTSVAGAQSVTRGAVEASCTTRAADQQMVFGSEKLVLECFFNNKTREDARLDQLRITILSDGGYAVTPFENFRLVDNGATVTQAKITQPSPGVFSGLFTIPGSSVVVPKNGLKIVQFPISSAGFAYAPGAEGVSFRFGISSINDIKVFGTESGTQLTVSNAGIPTFGGGVLMVRTNATVLLSVIGPTKNRVRMQNDYVASFRVTANPAFGYLIEDLFLSAGGHAALGGVDFEIIDTTSNMVVGIGTATGRVIFLSGYQEISAGQTKEFKVRVNSSGFANSPGTSDDFNLGITEPCHFEWTTAPGNRSQCLETGGTTRIDISYE